MVGVTCECKYTLQIDGTSDGMLCGCVTACRMTRQQVVLLKIIVLHFFGDEISLPDWVAALREHILYLNFYLHSLSMHVILHSVITAGGGIISTKHYV